MLRALLLTGILDLTFAATATGKPARSADPQTGVRSIDWLNRVYTVKLGADGYGPMTVRKGRAGFRVLDDTAITQSGDLPSMYRIDEPRYLDVDGDGVEDALITGAIRFCGATCRWFTTADVYTLRRGEVVRLATIDATDITEVETCKRNILITRDTVGFPTYWTYYWTGRALKKEPADDCASPGHCLHLCVKP